MTKTTLIDALIASVFLPITLLLYWLVGFDFERQPALAIFTFLGLAASFWTFLMLRSNRLWQGGVLND